MSTPLANQPAFPCAIGDQPRGVTKREWLAGLAMQGLVSNAAFSNNTAHFIAERALDYADVLLRKLEETK